MTKYKVNISIDEKEYFLVTIENGKVNRNPTKDDMKETKYVYYSKTNICPICREENNITDRSILYPKNSLHDTDNNGKKNQYVCHRHGFRHYQKYDPNSTNNAKKSVANCRNNNQNPNHESTKGDKCIELVCIIYDWEDLNKKNDNYEYPIDCIDHKTGLFHQIKGRSLGTRIVTTNGEERCYDCWNFSHFEREWYKEYEDMVCICKSKNGKMIERIYIFPSWIINEITGITIFKILQEEDSGMKNIESLIKMN